MVKTVSSLSVSSLALLAAAVSGASVPDGTWPTSQGTVQYSEAYTVAAGETFDGGMKTYERSDITCDGQTESGSSTAVFLVEAGATLKNVIIGANQMEGVHCDDHDCTIENVWWDDVCEDALSIKGGSASSVSTVTGGGARSADDKVVQHNGYGKVVIDGFYAEDFGKLYRSCGTCGDRQRFVSVSNVYAVNPGKSIVTVNDNYGDEATLSNVWISAEGDDYDVCAWSQGSEDGEPTELGAGIKDPLCQYSESDIHINEDVSTATSTSTATTSTSSSNSTSTASSTASSYSEESASPYSEASTSSFSEETTSSYSEETAASTSEEEADDDVYTVATVTPIPSASGSEEADDDVYSVATVTPEPSTEGEEEETASSETSEETSEETASSEASEETASSETSEESASSETSEETASSEASEETAGEADETATAPASTPSVETTTSTTTSSCKTRKRN